MLPDVPCNEIVTGTESPGGIMIGSDVSEAYAGFENDADVTVSVSQPGFDKKMVVSRDSHSKRLPKLRVVVSVERIEYPPNPNPKMVTDVSRPGSFAIFCSWKVSVAECDPLVRGANENLTT